MDKLEFENFEVTASDQNDDQKRTNDVRNPEEQAIEFSSRVIAALDQKAKEHNNKCTSKVDLTQLKKVYRRGAEALEGERGLHAMARVNMFLRMKRGGKIIYQKPKVEQTAELKELIFENKARIQVNTFIDITENWLPIEEDFSRASEDINEHKLNYKFKDINELYLDDYERLNIIWG